MGRLLLHGAPHEQQEAQRAERRGDVEAERRLRGPDPTRNP